MTMLETILLMSRDERMAMLWLIGFALFVLIVGLNTVYLAVLPYAQQWRHKRRKRQRYLKRYSGTY